MFLANLRGIETIDGVQLPIAPSKFLANLRGIETFEPEEGKGQKELVFS